MQANLRRLLMTLKHATDLRTLQSVALALRDHYKTAHLTYTWGTAEGAAAGCGTYSPTWVQHYDKQNYARIDPVVLGCRQQFHPLDWNTLDWSSKAGQAYRAESLAAGIGTQGYSIPVRGPRGHFAVFSVSDCTHDSAWAAFTVQNRSDLLLCAHAFSEKVLDLEVGHLPAPIKPLSRREGEVLTFLAMGYARGQVAAKLTISEHTLRAYLETARLKLGAANTTHAVARAVSEGLIGLGDGARTARDTWPENAQAAE